MSQKVVENESISVTSPHTVPSQNHDQLKARRQPITWNDAHATHSPIANKLENSEPFDIALGLTIKLDDNETRPGGFTRGNTFADTEHWGSRFSPRNSQPQLPALQSYCSNESALPSTLPNPLRCAETLHGPLPTSFQSALHDTRLETRVQPGQFHDDTDTIFRSFGNVREEGMWFKNVDEYGNKPLGMPHPFPLVGSVNASVSLSSITTNALPLSEHPYVYHQQSYPSVFTHTNGHAYPASDPHFMLSKPGQVSRPATASTSSSSSGSSSPPFTRTDVFDNARHTHDTWNQFDTRPNGFPPTPLHSEQFSYNVPHSVPQAAQNWNIATCDPRGIVGERERGEFHAHGNGYRDVRIPIPSHSPALSDLSGSSGSGEPAGEATVGSGSGRLRRADIVSRPSPYPLVPSSKGAVGTAMRGGGGMMYKIKKKSGGVGAEGQVLGMGLEDVDEHALEFTSRQDTKPTRMLRRQCSNCRTWRDVSAWRRSIMQIGHIVCNKCGLYEKAHKKSRPLNDRGEFVRPGKHVGKALAASNPPTTEAGAEAAGAGTGRGRGRMRGDMNALGVGVMRFDVEEPSGKGK